ncbi:MAG: aminoglycoside phosphotransferase family protein [Nocardioides sp.]
MPVAEVDVSLDLVRRLLDAQHPDLARRPLRVLANGWDNLMCRLGDDLVVRLPRRALAADLVLHEQRWLPVLAPRLPLPTPQPVRIGVPALGYPWSWSVVPYLRGEVAAVAPPDDVAAAAVVLGDFLGALHGPAPAEAPANAVRGIPLRGRNEALEATLADLAATVDRRRVLDAWRAALAAPEWDGPRVWLHGDLHPANILVDHGRVSGVIDFGDVTAGDPATDLCVAWMLLPADCHPAFRSAYRAHHPAGADESTWRRARGWALALSLAFLGHSADNPMMAEVGRRTLDAVLA